MNEYWWYLNVFVAVQDSTPGSGLMSLVRDQFMFYARELLRRAVKLITKCDERFRLCGQRGAAIAVRTQIRISTEATIVAAPRAKSTTGSAHFAIARPGLGSIALTRATVAAARPEALFGGTDPEMR
jgi:hypothetical protein